MVDNKMKLSTKKTNNEPKRKRGRPRKNPLLPVASLIKKTNKGPVKGTKYRHYSEEDKATALAMVDAYGGNVQAASKELKIPMATLVKWTQGEGINSADILKKYNKKRVELADLFNKASRRYLGHALTQEVVNDTSGKEAMTAAAIAADKELLLTGKPTSIVSHSEMNDEQFAERLRAFITRARATPALPAPERETRGILVDGRAGTEERTESVQV